MPINICSPLSSTFVTNKGYDLLIFLIPSNILGSSEGTKGSHATFITEQVLNLIYFIISILLLSFPDVIVAVFKIDCSIPSIKTQLPALAFCVLICIFYCLIIILNDKIY